MPDPHHRSRLSVGILAALAVAFLAVRVPLMYRQPGGQDEYWFSVPGYTVLMEGIPRVPYAPTRDTNSVFYKADEALFALPPAYFYWQAPFFLMFPAGYGTARLASALAGLIAVWLIYELGRQFYRDQAAALWAAGLYSVSRLFYFPAMFARPDMLCGALGLGALLTTCKWQSSQRRGWLVASGVLLGLGMLTHPFAIIYCVQVGVWVLIGGRGIRHRLLSAALLAACALAAFSLWLPLILAYPEPFRIQFFNNVLDRSGPGLLQRFFVPWNSLRWQLSLFYEHSGLWQAALTTAGLLVATILAIRRRQLGPVIMIALAWSSIYILAVTGGRHPTKGYLCYPGALVMLCTGWSIVEVWRMLKNAVSHPAIWVWAGGLALAAVMLPGAGLRTWMTHMRHWSNVNYNSPRFVQMILEDLPADGRYTVDPAYVFEFYLAGRRTTLAVVHPLYFRAEEFPYDYLVAGRYALSDDNVVPARLDGRLIRTYGDRDDLFACYAGIYRPARRDGENNPASGE